MTTGSDVTAGSPITALDVSVVVPVLNEEGPLRQLGQQVLGQLDQGDFQGELLFVDDGSRDGSFAVMEQLAQHDERVRAIKFRKNFGKSAALRAGFAESRSKIVVTIDADLQDDPAEIPRLIAKLEEGFDVVSGWKRQRRDPATRILSSRISNTVTALLTGVPIHDFNCGLKAYRRPVLDELDLYGELHRYIPTLAAWKSFRVAEVEVTHHPRRFGRSKHGVGRYFTSFFDLLTVMLLTRFTMKPLHLFGLVGTALGGLGFLICLFLVILKIQYGTILGRYPLLTLGVLLVITGLQFVCTGLLAELITSSRAKAEASYSVEKRLGV